MNQEDAGMQIINSHVIQEAEHLLQQRFEIPCEVKSVTFLSEHERRNVVLWLYLDNKFDDIPARVILKQSLPSPVHEKKCYGNLGGQRLSLNLLTIIDDFIFHGSF